jgi:hypothetical protein
LKKETIPFLIKIKTARSLGFLNILKVLTYRIQCKTGYFEKRLPKTGLIKDPLFCKPDNLDCPNISENSRQRLFNQAQQIKNGQLAFFSHDIKTIGSPPDWFCNPYNQQVFRQKTTYWTHAIDKEFGDIKILWEMSRMDWALVLSKMTLISKNNQYLHLLNHWLTHWIENNMPQAGPNWICAQETAIRLIQIIMCAHILKQNKPSLALIDFVTAHCQRISLTRHYANAQQNNHAISEAAGLFIGGMWLIAYANIPDKAKKWQNQGFQDLEWLIHDLIANDGSFAQHSLNYHRVLISTMNMVEYFRHFFKHPSFSASFYKKMCDAIFWMYQMVDPKTGKGPNLGANDGARVYALSERSYTDYRSEIQLGSYLFLKKRFYQTNVLNEPLQWLQLDPDHYPIHSINRKSCMYPDGGYVTFYDTLHDTVPAWGLIRCSTDRFRPHHADTFHFDFWVNGINVLRDSGSYSYDISSSIRSNLISAAAHNTASFDTHDQMPVISQFLYGQWIKAKTVQPISTHTSGKLSWCGVYTDYKGCSHQRRILIHKKKWRIIDKLTHFNQKAIVRWRLMSDHWILSNNCLFGKIIKLRIFSNVHAAIRLTTGLESLYYMKKTEIPVLEISVNQSPAMVMTEISLVDCACTRNGINTF